MTPHKHHDISNHQQLSCLFNSLFGVTSKLCITCFLWGSPQIIGGSPLQRASEYKKVFQTITSSWKSVYWLRIQILIPHIEGSVQCYHMSSALARETGEFQLRPPFGMMMSFFNFVIWQDDVITWKPFPYHWPFVRLIPPPKRPVMWIFGTWSLVISGVAVEVCEWISNCILYFIGNVITYPCWDSS